MVSVCLPSNALLQHLPSYLGFSYLGRGVSLHGCFSKAQPLLLTLDEGYLLTATVLGLQCGMAPLGPPAPMQPPLFGHGFAPPGCCPGLRHGLLLLATAPDLGRRVALLSRRPLLHLCSTLCNSMDSSPLGFFIHGILQARILEWFTIPSSRGYSQLRD